MGRVKLVGTHYIGPPTDATQWRPYLLSPVPTGPLVNRAASAASSGPPSLRASTASRHPPPEAATRHLKRFSYLSLPILHTLVLILRASNLPPRFPPAKWPTDQLIN